MSDVKTHLKISLDLNVLFTNIVNTYISCMDQQAHTLEVREKRTHMYMCMHVENTTKITEVWIKILP